TSNRFALPLLLGTVSTRSPSCNVGSMLSPSMRRASTIAATMPITTSSSSTAADAPMTRSGRRLRSTASDMTPHDHVRQVGVGGHELLAADLHLHALVEPLRADPGIAPQHVVAP